MAAAASPSLCMMEERDASGKGLWDPGSPPTPPAALAGGDIRGQLAGRWALLSRGTLTPPHPAAIASPRPTVLLPAALSAIRNKAHRGFLTLPAVIFGRGRWDSGSFVGKGFSGPVPTYQISVCMCSHTRAHTHTYIHTQPCVGITHLGSWEAGRTDNLWALPKRIEAKTLLCHHCQHGFSWERGLVS